MNPTLLILYVLTFGFALWFGLYLLARNPAKPLLRYAGLGLVAYALSLAADMLSVYATGITTIAILLLAQQFLVLLPAIFWTGALLHLLPEATPLRTALVRWWSRGLLPAAMGGYLFAAAAGLALDQRGAGPILVVLSLLAFVPLLLSLGLVVRNRHAIRPRRTLGLMLAATLMFALGLGLMLVPLGWLPRAWSVLGIGVDLALLALAIAGFDAFDEGQTLSADITRSSVTALLVALLFGSQIALAIVAVVGLNFAMLLLLLATVAAAIVLTSFADPLQSALDRLVFAGSPWLRRARDDARAAASALPRLDPALDLARMDEAEFARLTRRALSHYGDLPRLAANPLTRLPQIERRLARRGVPSETLEPATELKALLAESVARLKPRGQGDFGTSDEWRHYNALYFPYIAGIKPYSRRAFHERLDPPAQLALEWFQAAVPERTLYNWQTTAAKLVAQDLSEQMRNVLRNARYETRDARRETRDARHEVAD
jgi:hypothetical protein